MAGRRHRHPAGSSSGFLKRTAAVALLPGSTVTVTDFRPSSGCTNVTVCEPAGREMSVFGVLP